MITPFERLVAFRYLRARREEGFISIIALFSLIGIALGVATLIVVLSVMSGVREELINSIIGLDGHITVSSTSGGMVDYARISKDIATLPGVKNALPKVEGQVMVSARGAALGAMVVAYRQEDLGNKTLLTHKLVAGSLGGGGVVIGSRMAEKMGLHLGDGLTLISPEGRQTIAGMVPRVKAYPVTGIFSIGMFAYDSGYVLMPFAEAQRYFKLQENNQDAASAIEVTVENADQAPQIAQNIAARLGYGYRVYDWKSANSQIFQAVLVQRNVMFLILMLIILVASFNVISSLIMLVQEKAHDVAILRTMGASRASVMRIFFTCGASVGVIGTFVGVLLGLLIAFNTEHIQHGLETMMGHKLFADELYFLSHLPSKVSYGEVAMVACVALGLSFLATLYPARRAAKLDPAEALRYE